ncbi:MAG: hypothetical protein G01um101416_1093 [Microgenomates group bacterium Gr01-1014_16]|nr:MAG: hypothetical protein G01um101416_1093 [Microgenomates group bacterium Gr01-1014_16]
MKRQGVFVSGLIGIALGVGAHVGFEVNGLSLQMDGYRNVYQAGEQPPAVGFAVGLGSRGSKKLDDLLGKPNFDDGGLRLGPVVCDDFKGVKPAENLEDRFWVRGVFCEVQY